MPNVPGLRSCYDKVGRLIYFGRMLDKIRLHAAGQLPPAYHDYLGDAQFFTLDGRCCRFLGVSHSDIKHHVLAGETMKPFWPGRTLTAFRALTKNATFGTASSPS